MNNSGKFYNYIKLRRVQQNLTQTAVAKQLKIAISTVSVVETGQFSRFPLDKVISLAKLLKEDPDVFATLWVEASLQEQKEKLIKKIYSE